METTRRATVYLEPRLHKALKLKAAQGDKSVSDLVNEAIRLILAEDAIDLEAVEERKDRSERPFEEFVRELKKDGLL